MGPYGYQRLMWPLKLCDVSLATAQKLDSKANNYICKWLGLPQCLATAALFGSTTLKLPLKSISLGYRQEKVRLVFELRDSPDPAVQNAKAHIRTGCKWDAAKAVDQANTRLKHLEDVGIQQQGRAGFGWGPAPKMWSKASRKERKDLVISEVVKIEKENYKIKAVSQQQQGRWTTWEAVVNRTISWADMWRMPQARLSFMIRATYDTLPSPQNLLLWYGTEETCHLCSSSNPSSAQAGRNPRGPQA
ncbi:hypothetical protein ABVT39_009050 [Epinephelus coioides]